MALLLCLNVLLGPNKDGFHKVPLCDNNQNWLVYVGTKLSFYAFEFSLILIKTYKTSTCH